MMVGNVVLVFMCLWFTNARAKETLRLGALISQKGDSLDFTGSLVAFDLALQTVNDDPSLRYAFQVTLNDSMCLGAVSMRSFIDQIFLSSSSENQILLIGSDCSVATEPVAELSHNWNLVQISSQSTSPHLSDSKVFPLFLRTVPSDAEITVGITQAMKQFGWSRIAVITESANIFTFISPRLKSRTSQDKIKITREFRFNTLNDIPAIIKQLKNSPARIIYANMYEHNAVEVICLAARNGMVYPKYQWMFINWYSDDWWVKSKRTSDNCLISDSALQDLVRNSLTFDFYPKVEKEDENRPNVGNITWNYFRQYFDENLERYKINNTSRLLGIHDSAFMFDTVWTAALAINSTASKLPSGVTLKNVTYNGPFSKNISRLLYEEALKVKFFGLTGDVSFHENGDRPGKITFFQYRTINSDDYNSSGLTKVQYASLRNDIFMYDDGESSNTVFPDGITVDEEYIHIDLPLFVFYTVLALLGVFFAAACLLFNLWCKDIKLVKLTSPYVNVMIIAGAVIFYVTVILFGVDENVASSSTVDHLCQTRIWLVAFGFSLLFGTIFAKAWRIYYIFKLAGRTSKFAVKDIYLFAIVAVLVLIDTIIMLPSTVISSAVLRREEEEIERKNGVDLPQIVRICTSDQSVVWLLILFGYKGFVLLVGLFLAFETRKVKYSSLNESRFIAMSVYGAVIVSITLTPIGFLLENFPNVQYGVAGIMVLLTTTVILALLFVPKMYKVYNKREVYENSNTNAQTSVDLPEDRYKKTIESLNVEIKTLTRQLQKLRSGQLSEDDVAKSTDDLNDYELDNASSRHNLHNEDS